MGGAGGDGGRGGNAGAHGGNAGDGGAGGKVKSEVKCFDLTSIKSSGCREEPEQPGVMVETVVTLSASSCPSSTT